MKSYLLIGGLLISSALNAETLHLQPAAQGDLQVHRLVASKAAKVGSVDRAPAQFVWALDTAVELQRPEPYLADSREFWAEVDSKALAGGYRFHTTAPGALIRVSVASPAGKASGELPALELEHAGRLLSEGEGFSAVADRQALKAAGVEFATDTKVFKLSDKVGAGEFVLRAPKAGGSLLVHVNEPQSDLHLQLQTEADTAGAGDRLQVRAKLLEGTQAKSATRIGGLLTAPDGASYTVEFKADGDGYLATVRLPKAAMAGPELWELHGFVAASDGAEALYLRDAKTSFAVSAASARLSGTVEKGKGRGIQLRFDVQAASAGRYELRGTLYGTRAGELVPFAQAHSAAWLDAGNGQLALDIDKSMLSKAGVQAPFEIRGLELNDQSRLAKIEQRAVGLRIE